MPAKAGVSAPLRDPSLRWGDGSVLLCRKLRQDRLIPLHRWEFRETMPRAGLRPGQHLACITLHERREPRRIIERPGADVDERSEEHTSELQSLMRISYAVFCLKQKTQNRQVHTTTTISKTIENKPKNIKSRAKH